MRKLNLKLTLIAMATVSQIAAGQWNAPLITRNVSEGEPVSLTCRDPPKGKLIWFQGYNQVSNHGRRQTDQEGTLHFAYVEVADTGLYKCGISTSDAIKLGSPVQLNVKEVPGEAGIKVPVTLLQSSGNTDARLGEDVKLQCIFSGRPVPAVSWFHDNRNLSNSESVGISGGSVIIKQVSENDAGIYRCTGTNVDGEGSANMKLNVIDPDKALPSTIGHQETKQTTQTVGKTDIGTAKPNPAIEAGSAGTSSVSTAGVVIAVTFILWLF